LGRIRQAKAGEGGLVANGTGARGKRGGVAGGERRGRVEWRG